MDGFDEYEYTIKDIREKEIVLIACRITIGAAMTCTEYRTVPVMYKNYWNVNKKWISASYHNRDKNKENQLEGLLDTVFVTSNKVKLIATKIIPDYCTYYNNMLWIHTGQWNINVLTPNGSTFLQTQEIGKIDVNVLELQDGQLYTDSVGISYHFDQSPIALTVTEFKRKKNGEKAERVNETKDIEYQWDEKQKKFIER